MLPEASRPNEVLSLPMIAGMAHTTLKSGAATRDGVAFGYQLKIRVNGRTAEDHSPVLLQIGGGCGRSCSRSAADGLMGRIPNDNGWHARTRQNQDLRTFSDSFLSAIVRHGKLQLPCGHPQNGDIFEVIYDLSIAPMARPQQFPGDFVQDRLTMSFYWGTRNAKGRLGRRPSDSPHPCARIG